VTDLERFRERLEAERAAILSDSETQRHEREPEALDPSRVGRLSRMDAMQVREMAGATERRRRLRLKQLETALERIAGGEFGDCLACGEPIAPKRLETDPAAAFCIGCATSDA
jgi:DnaK suppressor protein